MAEQPYQAVLAVISEGPDGDGGSRPLGSVPARVHGWLARYEAGGPEGLADRSHRSASCPHQMAAEVEARCWSCAGCTGLGARQIVSGLGRRGVAPVP
ncbi:MAG TPA: leucine zipper domain-containing protein [Streptosporangiaceae bacterium]